MTSLYFMSISDTSPVYGVFQRNGYLVWMGTLDKVWYPVGWQR